MAPDERQLENGKRTQLLHRVFRLGMIAKGVDGALELIGGLSLLLASPAAIRGTISFLVRGELKEDPTDLVANFLVHHTGTVIHTRFSASAFLIVHGIVKLGLVGGLIRGRIWSYPVAIVVFTLFAIYQLFELTQQHSVFLGVATILDIVVILLVAAEYRHVRSTRRPSR